MSHKTGAQLVAEAKHRIYELSPSEAKAMLEKQEPDVVYVDVREPNEWAMGHVPGALHIPRGMLESKIEAAVPREKRVVVYCASGNRSALAADTMSQLGYRKVASMREGYTGWVAGGGPVEE